MVLSDDTPIKDVHPVAQIFPEPSEEEFEALKRDIEKNGQQQPVLVTPDGLLIDGRSRHRACQELELPTKSRVIDGSESELVVLVRSLNLHRRHLAPSQRAAIAVELLPEFEKAAKDRQRRGGRGKKGPEQIPDLKASVATAPADAGEAKDLAARIVGTNRKYVSQAAELKRARERLTAPRRKKSVLVGSPNSGTVLAMVPR